MQEGTWEDSHSAGLSLLCDLCLLNLLWITDKTWDNVKSLIHGHFISQLAFMGYFKTHLIIRLNWLLFIWTWMNRPWNCLEFHPIVSQESQQVRKADVNTQVGKKKVAFSVCPCKSRTFTKPFIIFICLCAFCPLLDCKLCDGSSHIFIVYDLNFYHIKLSMEKFQVLPRE